MALIKCPECQRDVSTLAVACPGCGHPIALSTTPPHQAAPPAVVPGIVPGVVPGVLRSNVDTHIADAPNRRSGFPLAVVLVLGLLLLVAVSVLLWLSSLSVPPRAASAAATSVPLPAATPVVAAAANPRRTSPVGVPLPTINDISCDALESTIFHIHVHLALFADGQELLVPFGIGIGQPWSVSDSNEGPFVDNGACFYWIHTHTEDGVLHIESPTRRSFTLGDFFAVWQQPLSPTQMGPVQGAIIAYVNGTKVTTNPADIRLVSHARIQLDSGQDVPPYAFDFPPGD